MSTVELAVLAPALLMLCMLIVQFGLWFNARQAALAAAQAGAAVARQDAATDPGWQTAAQTAATKYYKELNTKLLGKLKATAWGNRATNVYVTVSGPLGLLGVSVLRAAPDRLGDRRRPGRVLPAGQPWRCLLMGRGRRRAGRVRAWLRRLRDGRGSISVELVVLAPALALLLLLIGAGGRVVEAQGHIDGAARDAARAASLGRSSFQASQFARQAAVADLGPDQLVRPAKHRGAGERLPGGRAAARRRCRRDGHRELRGEHEPVRGARVHRADAF